MISHPLVGFKVNIELQFAEIPAFQLAFGILLWYIINGKCSQEVELRIYPHESTMSCEHFLFQKLATSEDFNCSWSLSAISAINSEFVGFPLVLLTVQPKNLCKVSRSPLSQATSIACLIARSTLLGVVWNVLATCGQSTLVMALACLQPAWEPLGAFGETYKPKG